MKCRLSSVYAVMSICFLGAVACECDSPAQASAPLGASPSNRDRLGHLYANWVSCRRDLWRLTICGIISLGDENNRIWISQSGKMNDDEWLQYSVNLSWCWQAAGLLLVITDSWDISALWRSIRNSAKVRNPASLTPKRCYRCLLVELRGFWADTKLNTIVYENCVNNL